MHERRRLLFGRLALLSALLPLPLVFLLAPLHEPFNQIAFAGYFVFASSAVSLGVVSMLRSGPQAAVAKRSFAGSAAILLGILQLLAAALLAAAWPRC